MDSEVALARTMVSKGKKELTELRAKLVELQSQEKLLEKFIADHERIVFSINKLPPEILSLIFLCTLSSDLTAIPKPVKTESPWLVSQVCRLWREVSLSCQMLWSFPIIQPFPNQSPSQFNLHLARAGNTQLHPILSGSARRDLLHLSRLMTSITACSERWVSLFLAMNWTLLRDQFAGLKGRVGQLKDLHIEGLWQGGGTALAEGQRLTAFAIAPSLRRLTVMHVCEPAVSLVIPWHQLTEYRAFGNAHEHLSVLHLCTNLVSAHLTFPTGAPIVDSTPVMVRLPHLVYLHVGDSDFLRILSLPMLQDIVVQKMAPEDDALLPLLALTRREHPPLSSISLVHSVLVTPTLVSILQENPTVKMLRIHIRRGDTQAADELIARLTISPNHFACFAPNLRTLEFIGRGSFNQQHFVDMVQSRWECTAAHDDCPCLAIERVIIRMTPKSTLSPNTVQRLRELEKEGLYLTIDSFSFFSEDIASYLFH
jgi:hypothetical protein